MLAVQWLHSTLRRLNVRSAAHWGDEAAREVTDALAEGLSEHAATKEDVAHLGEGLRGELREAEQRITIRLGL